MIHPTAVVAASAVLGDDVSIGAFTVIGDNVVIGDNCEIGAHVCVEGNTSIEKGCQIYPYAAIGGPPQDLSYRGEDTKVILGENTRVREYVTVHRGTVKGGGLTSIGKGGFLMAYCHVAHDCILGPGVIMANSAHLGGHIELGKKAIIGGMVAVHQFSRVGEFALVGGVSGVSKDIPPFTLAAGVRAQLYGLNRVGLSRNGFPKETISALKKAYRMAFRSSLRYSEAAHKIKEQMAHIPEAITFADFLLSSKRGVAKGSLGSGRTLEG
jgi:UDP-N-acetylglucosamine acyltransferase